MNKLNLFSVAITIIIVSALGFVSVYLLEEYSLAVFILIPFIIGFLPPYLISRNDFIEKSDCYRLSFVTLAVACMVLLIAALEGLVCIIMASPLLLFLVWLGSYLAFHSQKTKVLNDSNISILVGLFSILFLSFDVIYTPNKLIPVRTKIIVNSPIQNVWDNVVTFNKIDEPEELIFKTGISYPTDATIDGNGVGAIRYCNFTTGSFVEPITIWNEPNLLQFDVVEQPIPMTEMNPFWKVHPPHLDGYFKSYKGQFKLKKLSENQTELEGTTWYKVDISPQFYWKTWSSNIIHKIHFRVLNHIKKESES